MPMQEEAELEVQVGTDQLEDESPTEDKQGEIEDEHKETPSSDDKKPSGVSSNDSEPDSEEQRSGDADEPEAEAEEFDPELLSIASDYGFSESEAKAFATPSALIEELKRVERTDQAKAKALQRQAEEAGKDKVKGEDKKRAKLSIDITDDADEATLGKQINDVLAQVDERLGLNERAVEKLAVVAKYQYEKELISEFDKLIDEHGDAYKDVLGEGASSKYNVDSRIAKNRQEFADALDLIADQVRKKGRAQPSREALFQRAAGMVFGARDGQSNGRVVPDQKTAGRHRRASSRQAKVGDKEFEIRRRDKLRGQLEALRAKR